MKFNDVADDDVNLFSRYAKLIMLNLIKFQMKGHRDHSTIDKEISLSALLHVENDKAILL